MNNLIERLREESLYRDKCTLEIMDLCMEAASELEEEIKCRKKQADIIEEMRGQKHEMISRIDQLKYELEQVKTERDELIRRNQSAYEIAWGCDIPSPTVPEYIELHEGMTKVMNALRDQKG